jgi:periplasmic protein TonB
MQTLTLNTSLNTSAFSIPWLRFASVVPMAGVATLALLYAMYSLVFFEYQEAEQKPTPPIPTVVMPKIEPIKNIFETPPERPVEATPPPKVVATTEPQNPDSNPGLRINPGEIQLPANEFDPFATNAQIMPFIKVAPVYPATAISKGIEGYVDVLFDVNEIGATENIRILSFVPSSIFNKSVIKAVKGWKYKPTQMEGVAVKTRDVKERIRFNMQK